MRVREVVDSARVGLSQWQEAQDKNFDRYGDEHWIQPMENKIKVNTDAAIFHTSNCYSYAFAARNHRGGID